MLKSVLLCAGILGTASASALASPITYRDTGVGSGTIGSVSFTDALISLSFSGDTNNISGGGSFYTNSTGTGSVTIQGVGTGTVDGAYAFVNQSYQGTGAAGIGASSGSILDTLSDAFKTYTLGSIGATSGSPFFRADLTFSTSLGGLNITEISGDTTFSTSTVPLPASAPMFGAALLALAGFGYGMNRWVAPKGKTA